MEMEDYSRDEAWKYAIRKRKYLLNSVLEEFEPPELEGEEQSEHDDDDGDDDQPPSKILKCEH